MAMRPASAYAGSRGYAGNDRRLTLAVTPPAEPGAMTGHA